MFSLVVSNLISIKDINSIKPQGIILNSGPNLFENGAPTCDQEILI